MEKFLQAIIDLWESSGLAQLCNFDNGGWKNLIMIAVACLLLFLAIKKQFEPLLLLPIAFGMLVVNLPLGGVMDPQRNALVEFSQEEIQQYIDGTYEEVYPVYEQEASLSASEMKQYNEVYGADFCRVGSWHVQSAAPAGQLRAPERPGLHLLGQGREPGP